MSEEAPGEHERRGPFGLGIDMSTNLEALQAEAAAARRKRDAELRESFRNQDALKALIYRDCAELVAGTGGYAAPIEWKARREWIKDRMRNDPIFVAKAHAAANLLHEYVDAAMGFRADARVGAQLFA